MVSYRFYLFKAVNLEIKDFQSNMFKRRNAHQLDDDSQQENKVHEAFLFTTRALI